MVANIILCKWVQAFWRTICQYVLKSLFYFQKLCYRNNKKCTHNYINKDFIALLLITKSQKLRFEG